MILFFQNYLRVGETGPFQTVQPVQIVNYVLDSTASILHTLPVFLDNYMVYVYKGSGQISGANVRTHDIILLKDDPTFLSSDRAGGDDDELTNQTKQFSIVAGSNGLSVMVFAGKRLNEPVVWHGPFVMSKQQEIDQTIQEYQNGNFPPIRTLYDYKKIDTFPKTQLQTEL